MIQKFILTGDCHGKVFNRVSKILANEESANPQEVALIILGDAGLNFWLNSIDVREKQRINIRIYCVRGNHEERPENLGYGTIFDDDVVGEVYIDPINPEIRYFKDGGIYNIQGHSVLILGGAYSIDKNYRLERVGLTEETNDPIESGWFNDEQLTPRERENVMKEVKGKHFDFIFSHTAPISCEPTDLFLEFIDQSKVDKSMELWLEEIKNSVNWGIWCFGHYHADRIEQECVQQFYFEYEYIDDLWKKWKG
jgi:3-oxoacid CoA-transferase subunit A